MEFSSRTWPCPSREADIHRRHNASLQWRPARIADGVAAERDNRVVKLRRIHSTIQRFYINVVTVPYRKTIDLISAVKLRGTRSRATPPTDRRSHDRPGRRIHGHHLCSENSRHTWRRGRKRQWILEIFDFVVYSLPPIIVIGIRSAVKIT